ncbi:MAG: MerR family transcriptional regulator [Bifidobacteriaceae bacterium]|jgi:DNA-binding transcriptional MerR regulator|nr:MerR family transcriptional regulator [Bifidobacteriaceae bacterium]
MRSAELARLAGVSVRALRHYHQIGVLAEPDRDLNGYRRYDVHDLVRVLRIRRLASLGMALDQMAPLLDDEAQDAASVLESLDRELADQIEHLQQQRQMIARLAELHVPPDVPVEWARHFEAYLAGGARSQWIRDDRDQAVLLASLIGPEDSARVGGLYEAMADPAVLPMVMDLSERVDQLAPDTSETELEALASEMVVVLGPLAARFWDGAEHGNGAGRAGGAGNEDGIVHGNRAGQLDGTGLEDRSGRADQAGRADRVARGDCQGGRSADPRTGQSSLDAAAELLKEHAADSLNPAQRRLIELVEAKIAAA